MYSQENGVEFGYVQTNQQFQYNLQENMQLGRYCKSGMAYIDASANSMKCVSMTVVKTNLDNYAEA